MSHTLIQIIGAVLGSAGFCIMFNVKRNHVLGATMGSLVCWVSYLVFIELGMGVFASTVCSAALVGVYGETMAHLRHVPTTVYFMPGCLPLIPGGNLYYSILALIHHDAADFSRNAQLLVYYALGIAIGLGIITEIDAIRLNINKRRAAKKAA